MTARIKGRITREQTVWCFCTLNPDDPATKLIRAQVVPGDRCDQHHQEAGPIAKVARQQGWRRLEPRYGWMCPTCIAALGRVRAGALLAGVVE